MIVFCIAIYAPGSTHGLQGSGVKVLGAIPTGLHSFENPLDGLDRPTMTSLFIASIPIALIGYMESISIASTGKPRTPCRL